MLYLALLINFTAGCVVLIIEILGTRVIGPFFGATMYVWAALISITLLALSVGYLCGGFYCRKKDLWFGLSLIFVCSGLWLMLIMPFHKPVLLFSEHAGLRWGPFVASISLFFMPLFMMGMVTPFVVEICGRTTNSIGYTAGIVLAAGTLGSIMGAIGVTFMLIPHFSISSILLIIGCILASLAIALMMWEKRVKSLIIATIFILVALILVNITRLGNEKSEKILLHTHSQYGDLKILRVGPYTCLYVDASGQSCIKDDYTTDSRYVHQVKLLVDYLDPQKVFIVGMGGGSLLSVMPEESEIDVVELDLKATALAESFQMIPDKKFNLIIDDARRYARITQKKYDLIIMDLARGNHIPGYMYSYEALSRMKHILSDKGVIYVHLSLNPKTPDDLFVSSVLQTIQKVFGSYTELSVNTKIIQDVNVVAPHLSEMVWSDFQTEKRIDLSQARIMYDDYNPLDFYYLPHAIDFRGSVKTHGNDIYFAR